MFALLGALVFALAGLGGSPEQDEKDAYKEDPRVKRAVDRALDYLAKTQETNGSWRAKIGKYAMQRDLGQANEHVGITALALLAIMGDGNLPDRGRYADVVARGLEYVMTCVQDTGYVAANGSNMYTHGFATLFLAEIYGMTGREDVKKALVKSIDLLSKCQNSQGGWRYEPKPADADLSITVCQVQALRAARNKGIAVKKTIIDKALEYVKKCDLPDGGFSYQAGIPRKITLVGSSAAGLVCYYSMGIYDERAHERHFQYLLNSCDGGGKVRGSEHFFYAHYYAVQAFYQRGGEYWKRYWSLISEHLIASQQQDGFWTDNVAPVYATAMACIILQVPKELLPILQK